MPYINLIYLYATTQEVPFKCRIAIADKLHDETTYLDQMPAKDIALLFFYETHCKFHSDDPSNVPENDLCKNIVLHVLYTVYLLIAMSYN